MKSKIIVAFGGSFNPPTNAHFSIAEQILSEYEQVEKVLFIPVSDHYEKRGLLPAKHRVAMLKTVTDKNEKFDVCTIETDADHALKTVETLTLLQDEYPDHVIWFVQGTDNLKQLSTWSGRDELLKRFKVLVIARDDDDVDMIVEDDPFLSQYKDCILPVSESIRSNCSSTFIRKKLAKGKSIRYTTPDEIFFYINEHQLYSK